MQQLRLGDSGAVALLDDEDFERLARKRWHLSSRGYAAADGGRTLLHRAVLGLEVGDIRQGDHRDGNTLDNRRSNLRIVTCAENNQNRHGGYAGSTSAYRGVSYDRKTRNHTRRWIAQVMVAGRNYFLGRYESEEEAAEVAAAFRREHMPASTN